MAKGSHTTLGGWEPKLCSTCGGKVTGSPHVWFHHNHHTHRSYAWHIACDRQPEAFTEHG